MRLDGLTAAHVQWGVAPRVIPGAPVQGTSKRRSDPILKQKEAQVENEPTLFVGIDWASRTDRRCFRYLEAFDPVVVELRI